MPWKPPDKTLSNGLFYILYILVDFHISQEIIFVSWLLGWLSSIHSGCLWYQPGNTLQLIICLTSLADFLLFILVDFYISQEILVVDLFGWLVWLTSYKHSNWFSFQPRNTFSWLIWLTFLADFLLYIRLTFMSARKYFWLTYLVDSFVDLLLYILVVFYINQEILSRWLIR